MGIRLKVVLTNFTIYLIYMLIAIGIVSVFIREELKKAAQEQNIVLVESVNNVFLKDLLLSESTVEFLSNDSRVSEFISNQTIESTNRVEDLILENVSNIPGHDFTYILDTDGLTIFSTDSRLLYNNYSFREYFTNAIEGESGASVAVGVTTNEPGFYFSSPIYEEGDRDTIIGVLVMKFNPSNFFDSVNETLDLGKSSQVSIVDKRGIIFFSSHKEKLYSFLGQPGEGIIQETNEKRVLNELPIKSLNYNDAQNYVTHSASGLFQVRSQDNPNSFYTILKVDDYPFFIFSSFNIGAVDSALQNLLLIVISIVPILLIVGAILTTYMTTKQLKKLDEFINITTDAAKRRAKVVTNEIDQSGQKFVENYNKLIDEYNSLKDSFEGDLTDKFNKYIAEIESLQEINKTLRDRLDNKMDLDSRLGKYFDEDILDNEDVDLEKKDI